MDQQQLLDNLSQTENDLFELVNRVENIISFFQKSIGQNNYELEEVSLPRDTNNLISSIGKNLIKICHSLPQEIPHQSEENHLERFRKNNLEKVLNDYSLEIKRLTSNEGSQVNNENEEDPFI